MRIRIRFLVSLLLIVAMLAGVFPVSFHSHAAPMNTVSFPDYAGGVKGFDLKAIEVKPNWIVLTGDFPSPGSLNYTKARAYVEIMVQVYVDLDYNYSTGMKMRMGGGQIAPGIDAIIYYYYENSTIPILPLSTPPTAISLVPHAYTEIDLYNKDGRYIRGGEIDDANKNYIIKTMPDMHTIMFQINWTNLTLQYAEKTGTNQSMLENTPHRIYIVYKPLTADPLRFEDYSAGIDSRLYDSFTIEQLSPFTIPNTTINFTGSPSDWPSTALLLQDDANDVDGYPAFTDADNLYMAADNESLYLGLSLTGNLPEENTSSYAYTLYRYRISLQLDTNNDGETDMYLTISSYYDQNRVTASVYNLTAGRLYYTTLDPSWVTMKNNMVEVKIPFSALPSLSNLSPGSTINLTSGYYATYLYDYLDKPQSDNLISIGEVLVDPVNNLVLSTSTYNTLVEMTLTTGSNMTVESPGAKLSIPALTSNVSVTLGSTGAPPFPAKKLPMGAKLLGAYYFSFNTTTGVNWPVKLVVKVPGDYSKVVVYYYSKVVGGYKVLDPAYYSYDKASGVLTVTFTESLYNEGDPGILVYGGGTIGGVLTASAGGGFGLVVLLIAAAGLVVVGGFLVVGSRKIIK